MNNRELATVVWLGIALLWCTCNSDIRTALWQVVTSFVHPKVLGPVIALAAWTVGLVVLADLMGWWDASLHNDTVVWFVTVGIALLASLRRVREDGFFRRTVRRAFAVTVFVEGFVNLAVLPLPAELVLLPVVTFLGVLVAVAEAERDAQYALLLRLLNWLLALIGIGLFVAVVVRLVGDFDAAHAAHALLLPVWLTLGTVPLVYAVGLYSAYEDAFLRIDFRTDEPVTRRRAKRALVRAAKVRATDVGGFAGHWINDLTNAESDEAARALMRRWRATWRAEARDARMEDTRDSMTHWLEQTDSVLAGICEDALRDSWDRLDHEQRATLEREGAQLARSEQAAILRSLPG